ncbi:PhzF family phenazine biosynthesis protein [Candidatus Synechococcus spongiarum]|nr:PhzF family phenazine biosynthesis protein [Candidatus Synechococcus spongiarum]
MRIAQVDAFTTQPFRGNGAAVVLLSSPVTGQSLQALAAECAQSETAFLLHLRGQWLLRWFTPTLEVDLCGHGTMAAARALSHWGMLAPDQAMDLHSRSGPLPVEQRGAGFRVQLPTGQLHQAPLDPGLDQLLGTPVQQRWTSSLRYEVALVEATFPLARLALDQGRLRQRPCLGLVVMQAGHPATAGAESPDYLLRFFAPRAGIPEDPVTGSAHALVSSYWLARTGHTWLKARQASRRGGHLRLWQRGENYVVLEGETALVWSGELLANLEPGGQQTWEDLLP